MNNIPLIIFPTMQTRLIIFVFSIFLSSCNNTVGNLELKGKIVDASTKTVIPNITVIIEAVDQNEDKTAKIYAGDFTSDSSGKFAYTLMKIKNSSLYSFRIEGNPAYDPSNQVLGLTELNSYGKFLSFEIKRIVDFTIKINRNGTPTFRDTLTVSWETNGVDGRTLYPFKIYNYQINSGNGLIWIGGDIKSEIKTKVFADKNTIVHWTLYRNGKRKEITDTVFCDRNTAQSVYLNY